MLLSERKRAENMVTDLKASGAHEQNPVFECVDAGLVLQ